MVHKESRDLGMPASNSRLGNKDADRRKVPDRMVLDRRGAARTDDQLGAIYRNFRTSCANRERFSFEAFGPLSILLFCSFFFEFNQARLITPEYDDDSFFCDLSFHEK